MGKSIGTCGHEVEFRDLPTDGDGFQMEIGYQIAIGERTRSWERCISYMTVCETCYRWYKANKLILSKEDIENFWKRDGD